MTVAVYEAGRRWLAHFEIARQRGASKGDLWRVSGVMSLEQCLIYESSDS